MNHEREEKRSTEQVLEIGPGERYGLTWEYPPPPVEKSSARSVTGGSTPLSLGPTMSNAQNKNTPSSSPTVSAKPGLGSATSNIGAASTPKLGTTSSTAGQVGGPLGLLNATMISSFRHCPQECGCRLVEKTSATSRLPANGTAGPPGNAASSGLRTNTGSSGSSTQILKRISRKLGVGRDTSGDLAGPRPIKLDGGGGEVDLAKTAQESRSPSNTIIAFNVPDNLVIMTIQDSDKRELLDFQLPLKTKARVTCHDVSLRCDIGPGLRLLVGISSGETQYYPEVHLGGKSPPLSPIVFGKEGTMNQSSVIMVRWLPQSPGRFIVVYADGVFVTHEVKYKPPTSRAKPESAIADDSSSEAPNGDNTGPSSESNPQAGGAAPTNGKASVLSGSATSGHSRKSSQTTVPAPLDVNEVVVLKRNKRSNPVTLAQVGIATGNVTSADLDPVTFDLLALSCSDGYIRVVSLSGENVVVAFQSYFGGFLAVAWSPDGRLVATGGQDDLVSVFSVDERILLGRFQGHSSWVSSVAWDTPLCAKSQYRLASAGQDCRLILWDLDLETPAVRRKSSSTGTSQLAIESHSASGIVAPVPPRSAVRMNEPTAICKAHGEPLTSVAFFENCLITSCAGGGIRVWERLGYETRERRKQ